jgi:signal transduction histidine kinase
VLTREQAVERERSRIARDIHDDLGASLTQIALLSELTQSDFGEPEVARGHVEDIFQTARAMTRTVDEIVWAVNPKNDTLEQFSEYLGQFAQDFLRSANVACRLLFPGEMPSFVMTSALRHNLFLSVKEALKNVVCHSGADEVSLEVSVDTDVLTLVIRDNGCGIADRATSLPRPGGGNGLANIHKRMSDIGGTLEICGVAGKGTTVTLCVPLETACRQNCRHDAERGDMTS